MKRKHDEAFAPQLFAPELLRFGWPGTAQRFNMLYRLFGKTVAAWGRLDSPRAHTITSFRDTSRRLCAVWSTSLKGRKTAQRMARTAQEQGYSMDLECYRHTVRDSVAADGGGRWWIGVPLGPRLYIGPGPYVVVARLGRVRSLKGMAAKVVKRRRGGARNVRRLPEELRTLVRNIR